MKNKKIIIIFSILTIIFFFAGLIFGKQLSVSKKGFFSDEIIISSKPNDQVKISAKIEFNRQQLSNDLFSHDYFYTFNIDGKIINKHTSKIRKDSQISPGNILTEIQNDLFSDLSSRENYQFSLNLDNDRVQLNAKNLDSDFMTKNRPEYTKYISTGVANFLFNGQIYQVNVALIKIYSGDYKNHIFFVEPFDSSYHTDYLAFWDEQSNFYLIDRTSLDKPLANYPPHTWVVYKNQQANIYQKIYSANITYSTKDKRPLSWLVTIPQLNSQTINVQVEQIINDNYNVSIIGKIDNSDSSQQIRGFAIRYN